MAAVAPAGKKKRWGGAKKDKTAPGDTTAADDRDAPRENAVGNGAGVGGRTASCDKDDLGLHLVERRAAPGTNSALEHLAAGLHRGGAATHLQLINDANSCTNSSAQQQSNASLRAFLQLIQNDEHTFCLSEAVCEVNDRSYFDRLTRELEFKQHWMAGGTPLHRPSAVGGKFLWQHSAAYRELVRKIVRRFRISNPIYSIVNLYRDGNDSTAMHRDQYYGDANFTCGLSFGATRDLVFLQEVDYQRTGGKGANAVIQSGSGGKGKGKEDGAAGGTKSFSFPQSNGDIFAFSKVVNDRWRHSVPRVSPANKVGPRISLVVWGNRKGDGRPCDYEAAWKKDEAGFDVFIEEAPHIKDKDPSLEEGASREP
eukprot:g304.t1